MADSEKSGGRYTPAALAELLSRAGLGAVDAKTVEADVEAGAPIDELGRMHPVRYAAWLLKRRARGT